MTSRDERASYYDLELPDGTRTEVWAVLRAVLSPEEALGYVKACILTRIMRDGRKDVDRMREAEKVGIEAGMLREAMAAHLATPDPVTTALDAVDSHDPRECAVRIGDLEHKLAAQQMSYESQQIDHLDRIAELERERDAQAQRATDAESAFRRERTRADALHAELSSMRCNFAAEQKAAVATAEEMKRVRKELAEVVDERQLQRWRDMLQARPADTLTNAISRVTKELAALRDRYRERKQVEEKAPRAPVLAWNPDVEEWVPAHGSTLQGHVTWTHQPPAPGEGE